MGGLHVAMEDVVEQGLFRGARVGEEESIYINRSCMVLVRLCNRLKRWLWLRILETIVNLLEALSATFFWVGDDIQRKISWIKWEIVLNSIDKVGLGVGSLKALNLALLQKWR
uniref:Uncharacterized protein n=1 Tax=Lactuca sativa TaxID=4236 RepID=A0A9R1XYB4_LACSA|nr:hypothetical protein LSAT_V11C100030140 [Lactuca sativa]